MLNLKYVVFLSFMSLPAVSWAQKMERSYLRSGNRLYNDSLYIKAEVDYRKALEENPKSTEALYNLGNALSQQQKFQDAMEQYQVAAKTEKDKAKLASIYHNMGVLLQAGKQYPQCIEAYKQALRNNPTDDETRYNLALAQKLLKNQQENQQNQNNEDQQEDQKQQDKEEQKQQQEQQQDQQQQNQQEQQKENEMSKENAEQLLNAAMQDEKETQEKIKKQQQIQGRKLDKDW